MKKIFGNLSIFLMSCLTVATVSSCHTESEETTTQTQTIVTKAYHTIKGSIFDQDGSKLSGAKVTINGKTANVSGNTFESTKLTDGTYVVKVTKAGYKSNEGSEGEYTFTAKYEVVNGISIPVNQIAEASFYLIKEEAATIKLGGASASDQIVIETSKQDLYGTGDNVVGNTRNPADASLNTEIVVKAETPALTTEQVSNIEKQLPEGMTINDFSFTLTNLTSLSEAKSESRTTRTTIVVGDELPGQYSFFSGFNFTPICPVSDLGFDIDVILKVPSNDMKNALKLFRYVNNKWVEINANTTGNGISKIDYTQDEKIVIYLNEMVAQSFALGALIDKTEDSSDKETFNDLKIENNTSAPMTVNSVTYTAKPQGIILTNLSDGPMVDYLRKMIIRFYKTRAIKETSAQEMIYTFPSPKTLVVNARLYVAGSQAKKESVYSIKNASTSFKAVEYENANIYPYIITPSTPSQHGGGTND